MDYSKLIAADDTTKGPYIFVSYSRDDMCQAQNVFKLLKNNHFRFWYDMGIKSGIEWAEELGEKIDHCEQFLVLISPNSVKSIFVRKEITMAIERRKNILVVYLENVTLSSGLSLLLGNIQSIYKINYYDEHDFESAVCKGASNRTLYQDDKAFDDYGEGLAKKELLANYNLSTLIGGGGIGQVYLAEHKRTGLPVAVKCGLIEKSYLGSVVRDSFDSERRILEALTRSMCPNIPILLDWFEDDYQVFLVERLINGNPLDLHAFYSEEEVITIAKNVLNILIYLHGNHIIYRDIKPNNIIRDSYGEIYLIDFGTAMLVEKDGLVEETLLGTLGFAAPEQFRSDIPSDYPTDIYALGRTMECLLCPEQFDRSGSRIAIRYYRKDISVELESIIEKMTEYSIEDRYQSAEELLHILEKYKNANIVQKIILLIKSRKNIKVYKKTLQERINARNDALQEIAAYSEVSAETGYKTVILSDKGQTS